MKYYSEQVRRIRKGDDLILEVYENGKWKHYWETNERSNDYAYTEISNIANSLIEKLKVQKSI